MLLRNKILIYFILISSLFGAKYLAVLDLEPIGLSETEAKILTQRLTSKMIELSDYTIVERANIDKILKEQKFQHSGCTDSECAVEIGQLINADMTVIGTASKFGGTYTLDSRIINVESGEALFSASFTHTGIIDELVTEGIESIAHRLLGIPYKKKISSGTTPTAAGYGGTLDINSNPPGAEVYIGDNYFDTTPLILQDFPAGDHEIEIKMIGYKDYSTSVKLIPRGSQSIFAKMNFIPAYISFSGVPHVSKVLVEIDGKIYSSEYSASIISHPVEAGTHFIKISKAGYFDYLDTLDVTVGKTVDIRYDLAKDIGYLQVDVQPKSAKVYVDKYLISLYQQKELVTGTHGIKVKHAGYDDYTSEFEIQLNETTKLDIQLVEQFGHLDLELKPYNAIVYFNDEKAMELNLPFSDSFDNKASEFKLKPGNYDVRAERPFYFTKTLPAIINNNERTNLTLTLEPKSLRVAKKRAWMFPGIGHKYADSDTKGTLFMALGAATFFGAAYSGYDLVMGKTENYNLAKKNYLAATDPEKIQSLLVVYESATDDRNKAIISTAGFGAAYLTVWMWSVFDLNKVLPTELDLRTDIHLNKHGQLEASIAF